MVLVLMQLLIVSDFLLLLVSTRFLTRGKLTGTTNRVGFVSQGLTKQTYLFIVREIDVNVSCYIVKSLYEKHGPSEPKLIRFPQGLGVFLLPLGGMLVHHTVTPSSKFAGTHYTGVKRATIRVKCLTQEHNAVPRPARSGVQRPNHQATAPPIIYIKYRMFIAGYNTSDTCPPINIGIYGEASSLTCSGFQHLCFLLKFFSFHTNHVINTKYGFTFV